MSPRVIRTPLGFRAPGRVPRLADHAPRGAQVSPRGPHNHVFVSDASKISYVSHVFVSDASKISFMMMSHQKSNNLGVHNDSHVNFHNSPRAHPRTRTMASAYESLSVEELVDKLEEASLQGDAETVKAIASAGADVADDENKTALYTAAENGNESAVKALIEAGADVNKATDSDRFPTALFQAVDEGHAVSYTHLTLPTICSV